MAYLDALVDQFLAQLQRRGVPVLALQRIKQAIEGELDSAHRQGALVLDPIPSSDTPTRPDSPRATSRRMPATKTPKREGGDGD